MNKQEAIKILLEIDTTTVIDSNWYDYIKNTKKLTALLKFTGLKTYNELLKYYEGYYIRELIED